MTLDSIIAKVGLATIGVLALADCAREFAYIRSTYFDKAQIEPSHLPISYLAYKSVR
jgi:hypothetical protein